MINKEFKMRKLSLNSILRVYFKKNMLFTIDKLQELTGESKDYIRIMISRMKNPKYTGISEETLDLVQDIGVKDRIKRWGLRGAVDYADDEKFDIVKMNNKKEVIK